MTNNVLIIVIVLWVMVIGVLDFKKRTIPNFLSLGGVLAAILILGLTGETANNESIASSLLGLVFALIFTVPGYAFRVLGAGDVKLLSAIGALLGFDVMLISFAITTSAIAFVWILCRHAQHFIHILPFKDFVYQNIDIKEKFIPFGAVLASSVILTLFYLNVLNFS